MPLPKLQRIAGREHPFLYQINWDDLVGRQEVHRYQLGEPSVFDNRIVFQPQVSDALARLNGLLRPLIHKQWTLKVAEINQLPEARLEQFLFGTARTSTEAVREPLEELQAGRCFYCEHNLSGATLRSSEVDHFIPWARYPDNGLTNLVVAHEACNRNKRDFLAAHDHLVKWLARNSRESTELTQLREVSVEKHWELRRDEMFGVASAIYLRLPEDAELWLTKGQFTIIERERVARAFEVFS